MNHTHLARRVTVDLDRDIQSIAKVHAKVDVHLDSLSKSAKNRLVSGLSRGVYTATSGTGYAVYLMLAETFEFPVFAMGANELIVSARSQSVGLERVRNCEALWHISSASGRDRSWRSRHWYSHQLSNPGPFELFSMNRPKGLDYNGFISMLNVKTIWDEVDREATLEATSAILKGQILTASWSIGNANTR